jgi:hypothetical protein
MRPKDTWDGKALFSFLSSEMSMLHLTILPQSVGIVCVARANFAAIAITWCFVGL